jgi:hypothetical protein
MSQTRSVSGGPPPFKTSALSVWSLVLGVLSLAACFSVLTAIPAVICAAMALSRINRSGGGLRGRGLAIGGLVTGCLGILIAPLMLSIAIPNFVRAREMSQINGCINNLRLIDSAKQQWALEHGKRATDVPAESDLAVFLRSTGGQVLPKCPAGGDYKINAIGVKPTCSIPKHQLP